MQLDKSEAPRQRGAQAVVKSGVWQFANGDADFQSYLTEYFGSKSQSHTFQRCLIQIAERWRRAGLPVEKRSFVSEDGAAVLRLLSEGLKALDKFGHMRSNGAVDDFEMIRDVLKIMSPYWDGRAPFFFAEQSEHSAISPYELSAMIEELIPTRNGGRPRSDDGRTSLAIDELVIAWAYATELTPSYGKKGNSTYTFYNRVLKELNFVNVETSPAPGRRVAITGDPEKFASACIAGLRRGIQRWSDQTLVSVLQT